MDDREATVRSYYRALDDDAYDDLERLLAPEFVQYRPDRTFEGRDQFVAFMRDERPRKDTTHAVDAVYRATEDADDLAARGRLLDPDGDALMAFVDAFALEGERVTAIRTYTRRVDASLR